MLAERSKLVRMHITNIGPIGPDGLTIELDNVVCLVGANNTGKSTILRAYELALGAEAFNVEKDLSNMAGETGASVELWIHIPKETPNISEDWKKQEGNLLLVRSKWEWTKEGNWKTNRQTWNPTTEEYSLDDKASGLDTVFNSRLPQPFRIGTLEDPGREHDKLLSLVIQPVADRLRESLLDENSPLSKAASNLNEQTLAPVEAEKENLKSLIKDLNTTHNVIFPDLTLDLEIGIGKIDIDPEKLLKMNSNIKFKEWTTEIDWDKQGTGSQRALFWTMLQIRSKLKSIADIAIQNKKEIDKKNKDIKKLQKDAGKAKRAETKEQKEVEINRLKTEIEYLENESPENAIKTQNSEFALPGYMLLIDEPEVALHPNAIRAASDYLYGLGDDPTWQVILTTHSPQFIDPLKDHTTIVRLDRKENNPSPRIYRTDEIKFDTDDKDNLKLLNQFNVSLAEMFFGQYPVLVEGDTEFAAFQQIILDAPENYPVRDRPIIIRAKGKATLRLIIRMLRHFKVDFSILHDSDWPKRKDGKSSGAWTTNDRIYDEIIKARSEGLRVIHRISVPNFELTHHPHLSIKEGKIIDLTSKNKPWKMIVNLKSDEHIRGSIAKVLDQLVDSENNEEPFEGNYKEALKEDLQKWSETNGVQDDRISFDE